MAIPIRHSNPVNMVAAERTFFVTSTTWGRHRVLQSARSAELFVRTLYEYRAQGKYRLHEFVVMPDHVHLLITVGSQITIERAVQFRHECRLDDQVASRAEPKNGFFHHSVVRVNDGRELVRARSLWRP